MSKQTEPRVTRLFQNVYVRNWSKLFEISGLNVGFFRRGRTTAFLKPDRAETVDREQFIMITLVDKQLGILKFCGNYLVGH